MFELQPTNNSGRCNVSTTPQLPYRCCDRIQYNTCACWPPRSPSCCCICVTGLYRSRTI